ncbi:MAG: chitobiase/beta-hexosaminidase C-terminal domain-containing protein [Bacteroidetes bacterium]|nr:chitobiase/beta-hexosaminidase C-terminal domain-containing protein [Bacteroidota bacterium]
MKLSLRSAYPLIISFLVLVTGRAGHAQNLIWQTCLGGSYVEYGYSGLQASDGGYIMLGPVHSTDGNVTGGHGGFDFWLIKMGSGGNLLWQKCFGGPGDDLGIDMCETSDGEYILAGQAGSNGGTVAGNHGNYDAWVVKLSGTLTNPVFNPPAGTSGNPITFTISAGPGSIIHYSTDGSNPTCASSPSGASPLSLTTPAAQGTYVYKAIACETNWNPSGISSATYEVTGSMLQAPVFVPPNDSSYSPIYFVIIADPGSTIHYTTDGSTPDCNNGTSGTSPVSLITPCMPGTYTYKAIACQSGFVSSSVSTGSYTVLQQSLPAPYLMPSSGTSTGPITFTITSAFGSIIHYTTDGSIPDCSTSPSGPSPIILTTPDSTGTYICHAIACDPAWPTSSVSTGTYIVIPTGIENPSDYDAKILVFPNPANDYIRMVLTGISEVNIILCNSMGETMPGFPKSQDISIINLSSFPKGIYFLKISGRSKITGQYLVKTTSLVIQ